MADLVDGLFFKELASLRPEDVCRRAICDYNKNENFYLLRLWNQEYRISPEKALIEQVVHGPSSSHEYLFIFIIHYLLGVKEILPVGKWVSEKDIPTGASFFRGPHELPTQQIAARYQNDIPGFTKLCLSLGGTPLEMADAAFAFNITPRIPVAVLFWEGDDLFAAEAKLLFDKTIAEHLALDIIYALAVDTCSRIAKSQG